MKDINEILAMSEQQPEAIEEQQDLLQMVGFYLGGELYGVDILMVQEILKQVSLTSIPDAPDFIEGVINLRGRIIPIINLRKRLKMPLSEKADQIESWTLILDIGERITGFVVDRVTRVIKVPADAIQPPPEMVISAMQSNYISGVYKLDAQPMAILDFNRILVADEFKKLAQQKRQQIQP